MRKMIATVITALALVFSANAHGHYHHHHHGWGGRHGWIAPAAFGTGLLIGTALRPAPPTVVVAAPAVRQIWVPGYYVTEYDAYGRPFSRWIPGHYEYR
jgi:hypothetical protein